MNESFIIAFAVLAVYTCFQDGMIFSFIRIKMANEWDQLLGQSTSKIIQKPLWDCLVCMTFWWGGAIALFAGYSFISVVVAMGMNAVIDKFLDYDI
jgi:hypothetical protein